MAITDIIKRKSREDEWTPIAELQRDMNRLFESFWTQGFPSMPPLAESFGEFLPSVEVSETDKHIEVSAELPGMSDRDIEVTLSKDNDVLLIKGEKKEEKEKKGKDFYRAERRYGSFRRTIALPAPVDPKKVEAKFKNGVLEMTLHKASEEGNGTKKIPVKAS